MRNRWLAGHGLAAVAVVALAACGSSASGTPASKPASTPSSAPASSPANGNILTEVKTTGSTEGTFLTNAKGFTLYTFSPDTSTASACNGQCAKSWPPAAGPGAAASGVTLPGKFGTITRKDGTKQLTYNGHPLYTFATDTQPGVVLGIGLKAAGGVWNLAKP